MNIDRSRGLGVEAGVCTVVTAEVQQRLDRGVRCKQTYDVLFVLRERLTVYPPARKSVARRYPVRSHSYPSFRDTTGRVVIYLSLSFRNVKIDSLFFISS